MTQRATHPSSVSHQQPSTASTASQMTSTRRATRLQTRCRKVTPRRRRRRHTRRQHTRQLQEALRRLLLRCPQPRRLHHQSAGAPIGNSTVASTRKPQAAKETARSRLTVVDTPTLHRALASALGFVQQCPRQQQCLWYTPNDAPRCVTITRQCDWVRSCERLQWRWELLSVAYPRNRCRATMKPTVVHEALPTEQCCNDSAHRPVAANNTYALHACTRMGSGGRQYTARDMETAS